MLNELLKINKGKNFKYDCGKVDSYISEFQLRQISIAYIQVVIDTLKRNKNDANYNKYNIELKKVLNSKVDSVTVGTIIQDFRNKTFHPQCKSFSNTKELYSIYFNNIIEKCDEIIGIFENIFYDIVLNKQKIIKGVFKFYESDFYSKLKKEGEKANE